MYLERGVFILMSRMNGMRTGFMMGSLMGVFAGMFLASKRGHRVRESVKHFVDDASDNVTETWENIQERMYNSNSDVMETMSQTKHQMEIGEIGKPSGNTSNKSDQAKADALVQAFLVSEGSKSKKNFKNGV